MSPALRLLVVSDVSPMAFEGGGERVLGEQTSRLAKRGHQVRILSRAPRGETAHIAEPPGLAVRHFPVDRRSLGRFVTSSILGARRAAAHLLAETDVDVLHLHQPLSGYGTLCSPAGRRIPSLYTFYSPAPLEYRARRRTTQHHRGGWLGHVGMALLWTIERACLRRATRIHVLSDFAAIDLRRLYRTPPNRVVKIPGGVDTARFRPAADRLAVRRELGLPMDAPMLFTLRNLEPRMGLDNLLRAMAILRRQVPDALLLIGGAGLLRGDLEALAGALGLRDRVRFLGFVPETDLPRHYQAADVFVLPTRELEGFGLITVESLACGTPVLGTPVGATREVLGGLDAGLLFEGADPGAIASGIEAHLRRARSDPDGHAALRRHCRAYAVTRFAWDRVVGQLEQQLLELASRPERAPRSAVLS